MPISSVAGLSLRVGNWFRTRRMRRFLTECALTPTTRVLDVGGNPLIWATLPPSARPHLVYLNLPRAAEPEDGVSAWVFADGRQLPFADKSFDLVFSNSVIEHVGSMASQKQFADEIQRVGRTHWVQTPNRWFPVEPHLLTPLIHWLPRSWQRVLVPRVSVWALTSEANPLQRQYMFDHYFNDIVLLTAGELASLFPESRLIRERALGWTKSFVATNAELPVPVVATAQQHTRVTS